MDFVHSLFQNTQSLGLWGYWLIFAVALLESVVLVGTIVPGTTLVVLAGFFSAHGYLHIVELIYFAAAGAILGDGLSYYLGTQGSRFFRLENRIFKLKHLEKGRIFFEKHGSKSILFGRFIGPIRSIVPFIAGLFKMNKWTYWTWNVIGGLLWAPCYLLLGYFFGGSVKTFETWATRFGIFLLFLFFFFLLLWVLVRKSGPFFRLIKTAFLSLQASIDQNPSVQRFRAAHPAFFGFLSLRLDQGKFSGLPLTLLSLAFIYILSLLLGIVQAVINSERIVTSDLSMANLLYAFRDLDLMQAFLWISFLLNWKMIAASLIVISALCWLWGRRVYIVPLWTVIGGSELFSFLGKWAVHRQRPALAFYAETTFSFPSGHATMAVALCGFIAYILFRESEKWKHKINLLFVSLIFIFAVGIARLYLGVHFLSDVWGGYLLGALWLIIGVSLSETLLSGSTVRPPVLSGAKLKIVSTAILLGQLIFYLAVARYDRPALTLFKAAPPAMITRDALAAFRAQNLPKYTETLFGKNQTPLSFMVIAEKDAQLIRAMQKAGWYAADQTDYASLLRLAKSAFLYESYPTAPLTPSFWNAQVQDLGFEKPVNTKRFRRKHRARFWRTSLELAGRGRIYVGSVTSDKTLQWLITHAINRDIDTEREILLQNLEDTGLVLDFWKEPFVQPTLDHDISDSRFFTDGKLYLIILK